MDGERNPIGRRTRYDDKTVAEVSGLRSIQLYISILLGAAEAGDLRYCLYLLFVFGAAEAGDLRY